MNRSIIVTLASSAAVVAFGTVSYFSAYNTGNRLENAITATYENNINILSQYGNKIAEAAQIPDMQRDDLTAVVTAALTARYGDDGAKAMFQMITEANPTIDSSVYTNLQQIIEAGRNDFQLAQTKLIDQKRVYNTALGSLWGGTWMSMAGYPKIDLEDYSIVVTSDAQESFDTGINNAIQLRN